MQDGLEDATRGSSLGTEEKAFARELALGSVRRLRFLEWVVESWLDRGLPPDPEAHAALVLGAYQLLFTRVPEHAAVAESVSLVSERMRPVANAVLRRVAEAVVDEVDPDSWSDTVEVGEGRVFVCRRPLPEEPLERLSLLTSLPRGLLRSWTETVGGVRARERALDSLEVPGLHLRPAGRYLEGARTGLQRALADRGTVTAFDPGSGGYGQPGTLRVLGGRSPFATGLFTDGGFVVQDPTALRAVDALEAQPGETVLDLCAAPGTKTARLAEQVGSQGRVFAFDSDRKRAMKIDETKERLGLDAIERLSGWPRKELGDRALVDVPCSNTGVLARRVEVRHRLDPRSIVSLVEIQQDLLSRAVDSVRRGGRIVYSTCSLEVEENRSVVDAVLAARQDLRLIRDEVVEPRQPLRDGGYHAVLERV